MLSLSQQASVSSGDTIPMLENYLVPEDKLATELQALQLKSKFDQSEGVVQVKEEVITDVSAPNRPEEIVSIVKQFSPI